MNKKERHIMKLRKNLEREIKYKSVSKQKNTDSDNKVKANRESNSKHVDSKYKVENKKRDEERAYPQRERKIIKAPIYIPTDMKQKKGVTLPIILLAVTLGLGSAIYSKTGEFDLELPSVNELIGNEQNINKTGNINDRVYLSKDMKTVTIRYEDSSGKECKKEYEFSEEARDYYTQICNNNEFYSKNAQAGVICALMMLNKGINYKYGGGICRMEPTKTYDCSKYVDEVSYLATGDNLGSGTTETLRSKGKEISEDDCMPGDIREKRKDADGKANHVVIYLGKFDDGKWYIIDCSSPGVTVRTRNDVPICIRLDRFNTNEIKNPIKDREGR